MRASAARRTTVASCGRSADGPGGAVRVKATTTSQFGALALALILVLWTYAGWHEAAYVAAYHPVYAYGKIPLERISEVHVLEQQGFGLIECQIRSSIALESVSACRPAG